MSTRMQQRRGTSSQWTTANSVLASGEIGFETNTGKFKIGNGTSAWADLVYYASSDDVAAIIDGAPTALNTLKELAAAIDNNASFASTIVQSLSEKASTASVSTSFTSERSYTNSAITSAIDSEVSSRNSAISTAVSGLASLASPALTGTPTAPTAAAGTNTTQVATTAYAKAAADAARTAAEATAASDATTKVATEVTNRNSAISTHNSATTNVHGITDTSALALTATVNSGLALKANLASPTFTGTVSGITSTMVGLGNVDNTSDANKPVSTATTTALALKAPLASPTFTGTVSGITSTMVGLGNVDNTSDANKPVSTATTTALALKAPLASPTFTGTVTIPAGASISGFAPLASPALTGTPTAPTAAAGTSTTQVATTAFVGTAVSNLVASAPAALDTLNELATALGNDASFSTTITNALAAKAPLASPTFTGTVTIPAGASISGFAPLASPTFTGTNTVAALTVSGSGLITASSAGVAFTDGTQTKEGVISRTPIVQKTASYTLSALTERDSLVEISSASGVTLTVPTNATVAYPVGTSIDILQTGAGQITVAGASGVTINATPGLKLRTQWSGATLFKRATDTWVLYGDLSA